MNRPDRAAVPAEAAFGAGRQALWQPRVLGTDMAAATTAAARQRGAVPEPRKETPGGRGGKGDRQPAAGAGPLRETGRGVGTGPGSVSQLWLQLSALWGASRDAQATPQSDHIRDLGGAGLGTDGF